MMNATEYRKAIKAALVVALGPDVAKLQKSEPRKRPTPRRKRSGTNVR